MLDDRLDEVTRERARATDVDWGNAWLGPVEGSLAAFPAVAANAVGVRALTVLDHAAVDTPLEPLRRHPAHASEMVSEVRSGERLRRLVREEQWWLVAGEDDYVGWIHDWVLEPNPEAAWEQWKARRSTAYGRPLGTLWISDHHAGSPLALGTPLLDVDAPVRERGEWKLLATTSGVEGWVQRSDTWNPTAEDPARLALDTARMLLGTPYRWGGRSPMGFDCSGLVQFVAQLAGLRLPRDAAQQQRVGTRVELDSSAWRAGDLLYFGERADHVGLYDGRGGMIHCRARVRRDALSELAPLMARLHTVRRPWNAATTASDSLWTPAS